MADLEFISTISSTFIDEINKFITTFTSTIKTQFEDIENKVKLTLLRNGFKISNGVHGKDFLHIWVQVNPLKKPSDIVVLDISYMKFSANHFDSIAEKDSAGVIFKPLQGYYSTQGLVPNKSHITDSLNRLLEKFLVDYMESNIE